MYNENHLLDYNIERMLDNGWYNLVPHFLYPHENTLLLSIHYAVTKARRIWAYIRRRYFPFNPKDCTYFFSSDMLFTLLSDFMGIGRNVFYYKKPLPALYV